jgi:hypothetical protein
MTNLSLQFQKQAIVEYAQKYDFLIVGRFGGTCESANTDGRKDFIEANKGKMFLSSEFDNQLRRQRIIAELKAKRIATLVDDEQLPGVHRISYNTLDRGGRTRMKPGRSLVSILVLPHFCARHLIVAANCRCRLLKVPEEVLKERPLMQLNGHYAIHARL